MTFDSISHWWSFGTEPLGLYLYQFLDWSISILQYPIGSGEKGCYFHSEGPRPKKVTEGPGWLRYATVNDALVDVTPHLLQTLFQFFNVVHPRLVHSLLDDTLHVDPVINWIKVRAVRWPKIRWNERRRCLFEKSHSVACRCAGALPC